MRRTVRGEVRFDAGSRALYATDGSNYRQVPIGVVVPRSVADVVATVYACLGVHPHEADAHPDLGATALVEAASRPRVIAIGDSVRTDLKGANDLGVDCLFVTAGIHAEELGHRDDPDIAALARIGDRPRTSCRYSVIMNW